MASFGWAVDKLKLGYIVKRLHWTNSYLVYITNYSLVLSIDVELKPWIAYKSNTNTLEPYTRSDSDILALDWIFGSYET